MHVGKSKLEQSNVYSLSNCTSIDLDKKVALSKALKMSNTPLSEKDLSFLEKEIIQSRIENVEEIITYDPILALDNYSHLVDTINDELTWNKEAVLIFCKDVYGAYILERDLKLKTIGEKAFLEEIENRR
jgi:hypothetical protein